MRLDVITIFPGYLTPLRESLVGKAIDAGIIELDVHDLRAFADDVHRTVDDAPYGGGPGMVMKPDVWARALDQIAGDDAQLIVPTPAGRIFDQELATQLSAATHLVFACGRYEGIDQRMALDAAGRMPVHEISIGDYVLAGGEVAVLVMVEAIARLLPGVLGNPESAASDSFGSALPGLLEAPAYTRPPSFRGLPVPVELTSGNHAAIERYRRDESLRRTFAVRPELLAHLRADDLDDGDYDVLVELGAPLPHGLAERITAARELRARRRKRKR